MDGGVGRSHFDYRAGVVFNDIGSLRDGLHQVISSDGSSYGAEPQPAMRVAFLYTGDGNQWMDIGKALYDTDPSRALCWIDATPS